MNDRVNLPEASPQATKEGAQLARESIGSRRLDLVRKVLGLNKFLKSPDITGRVDRPVVFGPRMGVRTSSHTVAGARDYTVTEYTRLVFDEGAVKRWRFAEFDPPFTTSTKPTVVYQKDVNFHTAIRLALMGESAKSLRDQLTRGISSLASH
ncbi:MAG: hypothetical protein D6719_03945 [Candidatus Dadabacteria bacterium]|nr:MAG: hypothetical protein D6719_03945 [Candidatus Dadabacteria bacterium]